VFVGLLRPQTDKQLDPAQRRFRPPFVRPPALDWFGTDRSAEMLEQHLIHMAADLSSRSPVGIGSTRWDQRSASSSGLTRLFPAGSTFCSKRITDILQALPLLGWR